MSLLPPIHNNDDDPSVSRAQQQLSVMRLHLTCIGKLKAGIRRNRAKSVDGLSSLPSIVTPLVRKPSSDDLDVTIPAIRQSADSTSQNVGLQPGRPKEVFHGPKVFWKQHLNTSINVFHHESIGYFEIKAYDIEGNRPLPSLFVPVDKIYELNEKEFNSKYRAVVAQRRDLVERARLTSAVEYIMDAMNVVPSKEGPQLTITRYNAMERSTETLNESKPQDLVETNVPHSNQSEAKQLFGDGNREQRLDAASGYSEAARRDSMISAIQAARAASYQQQAAEVPDPTPLRVYGCEDTINPNKYSKAKWAWLWAFQKVIVHNRIQRSMMNVFTKVVDKRKAALALEESSRFAQALEELDKYGGRYRKKSVSTVSYMNRSGHSIDKDGAQKTETSIRGNTTDNWGELPVLRGNVPRRTRRVSTPAIIPSVKRRTNVVPPMHHNLRSSMS
mmetsp:Transcript_24827/g.36611  ORF Transcript_24827/g.36611 Transcript_24827/m.36611 type:complete len:446 (-) Transcript_24827:259-1596(-)|eukprot:CAMPEP_0185027282 /NCGR_PEP_ID=MMETSP1103-20130426/12115_1 /TAXON_ID=36769 /ORGANISM="Paraphysomonas bandaiensis, Strain Caron Lab Isolate" /LENGTH=445 /DNA_ID=CAMNT_0027561197 /DNA_START=121 /DNA_END=1458 /DNA_ORIENTATION=-